jgi:hypothetical protein
MTRCFLPGNCAAVPHELLTHPKLTSQHTQPPAGAAVLGPAAFVFVHCKFMAAHLDRVYPCALLTEAKGELDSTKHNGTVEYPCRATKQASVSMLLERGQ